MLRPPTRWNEEPAADLRFASARPIDYRGVAKSGADQPLRATCRRPERWRCPYGSGVSTASPDPSDRSSLAELQSTVFQELGQCVVRLQQYELLMKDLLARYRVQGPVGSMTNTFEQRAAYLAQRTLGQLVGEASTSLFVDPDQSLDGFLSDTSGLAETRVGIAFALHLDAVDRRAVEASLMALVALRNELVHGFVAAHDISTPQGCKAAIACLESAHQQVVQHLDGLRGLYRHMNEGYVQLAALLEDPRTSDYLFHGICPDGTGVHWAASTIVRLLRHAENELHHGDWTQLDDAVALIRGIAPDHAPSRYGCASWRQVLHEARPLFVFKRDRGDGRSPGKTWYRSAEPLTRRPEAKQQNQATDHGSA